MLMHDIAAFEVRKNDERKTRARIRLAQRRGLRWQAGRICSGPRRRMRMHPMRLQNSSCNRTAMLFDEVPSVWISYDESLDTSRSFNESVI